ncbi:unnamed protein product [Nezara viridula]|uniref:Uncharacterized protein n=1 Tax=Nezara viridula TaxID=85310 RepID=A0A9P0MWH7_NEZVI|nr:unnamed protein product [Nezara viridula]
MSWTCRKDVLHLEGRDQEMTQSLMDWHEGRLVVSAKNWTLLYLIILIYFPRQLETRTISHGILIGKFHLLLSAKVLRHGLSGAACPFRKADSPFRRSRIKKKEKKEKEEGERERGIKKGEVGKRGETSGGRRQSGRLGKYVSGQVARL